MDKAVNEDVDDFKFPEPTEVSTPEKDADFEVEIIDDTPLKDQGRKPLDRAVEDPTDEEISAYSDKVQSRIKELTHARHDERRAKEATLREKKELETLAQRLLDENRELKQRYNEGAKQYAETVSSAADMELAEARRKLKEAHEAFDTDAIIEAQEALADAKAKQQQAKNFRPTALQEEKFEVQTKPIAQPQPQLDEKTLRWQAKNQWFGAPGFEEVTSYALGLHQKLVNSGVESGSDRYFETVDSRIKSKFPEVFGEERQKPSSSSRPGSVVAPASRSAGVKRVQLTTTQQNLAKKYGLTLQQYAAEVLKLENRNG